ncbi:MAG: hypothetical protein ACFE0P_08420 [Oceanicaulis sp.]
MVRVLIGSFAALIATIALLTSADALQNLGGNDRIENAEVLHQAGSVAVFTAPTPDWVLPAPAGTLEPSGASPDGQPLRLRLYDEQTTLAGPNPVHLIRTVAEATGRLGVQGASVYTYTVASQTAQFHLLEADIIREGERIDMRRDVVINAAAAQSFDGQIMVGIDQIIVRVPGVRPGDLVVMAHAVVREEPEGALGRSALLEPPAMGGADHVRLSLRTPAGDAKLREFAPLTPARERVSGGVLEQVFVDGVWNPTLGYSDLAPWRPVNGAVSASVLADWGPIARWADALYEPVFDAEIAAIAAEIRARHAARDDQIAAALFWVQREIRYFAEVLGQTGYMPQAPSRTLRLREGDCKAKTLLLISLLAELGVEAHAALVHTEIGPGLREFAPSVGAFNHVIVTFTHGGERYFLDPTNFEQAGRLSAVSEADYGYALIAEPGADALTAMAGEPGAPLISLTDTLSLDRTASGAVGRLDTELVMRGVMADALRLTDEYQGRQEVLRGLGSIVLGQRFAMSRVAGEPTLTYDDRENTVTLRLSADVALPRTREGAALYPLLLGYAPFQPPKGGREMPLLLAWPYHAEHRLEVTLSERAAGSWPALAPLWVERRNPAFAQTIAVDQEGDRISARAAVRMRARELDPIDFAEAARDQQQAMEELTLSFGDGPEAAVSMALYDAFEAMGAFQPPVQAVRHDHAAPTGTLAPRRR